MSKLFFFPSILGLIGTNWYHASVLLGVEANASWSFSAWVFSGIIFSALVIRERPRLRSLLGEVSELICESFVGTKLLFLIVALLFGVGLWQSTFPPHHSQEYDAINYHMGIIRQHLMARSLEHIPWSTADLWPHIIHSFFAPFWNLSGLINKIPQFIFSLWGFFLMMAVVRDDRLRELDFLVASAFFATHGVMIQMGSAMLDLPQMYFLFAAIYALRTRSFKWATFHVVCFSTLKAFSLFQVGFVFAGLLGFVFIKDRALLAKHRVQMAKLVVAGIFLCSLFLLRTFWVGIEKAGTPLFPFATCAFKVSNCMVNETNLKESANQLINTKNVYGNSKGVLDFVYSLGKLALPSFKSVNNEYDYPLGFSWWLILLFLLYFIRNFHKQSLFHQCLVVSALLFWLGWWMGSQQARWLYPTIGLALMGTKEIQKSFNIKIYALVLMLASALSLVSLVRAFKGDFFHIRAAIQREQENLVQWDQESLLSQEMLYVDKPVKKHGPGSPQWILGSPAN